ncbi:MAG: InlB B-repeat-containing protein [Clostridia bacterium]|nr:InlB B-repeat-containing protein [Clostridia bacterium]
MKIKISYIFCAIFLLCILTVTSTAVSFLAVFAYDGYSDQPMLSSLAGEGSASSPYLISDYDDLIQFADYINNSATNTAYAEKYYTLTSDIDLGGKLIDGKWSGTSFMPIGSSSNRFRGVFNGNGCTIKNLYIKSTSATVGLFGYCEGATLLNVAISSGYVEGGNNYVGALCGIMKECVIKNAFSLVDVVGMSNLGGIVGYADNSDMSNMVFGGTVYASLGSYSGGLVGNNNKGKLFNSFCVGKVTGYSISGVIAGVNSGTVSACFYDTLKNGSGGFTATSAISQDNGTAINCKGLTTSNMVTLEGHDTPLMMTGFDFSEWTCNAPSAKDGTLIHYYPKVTALTHVEPIELTEVVLGVFSVKFMNNYGNGGVYTEVEVIEGDALTPPKSPERSGYTFSYWSLTAAGTSEYDFSRSVSEAFTLYAVWTFDNPVVSVHCSTSTEWTYNPQKPVNVWVEVGHGSKNIEYLWLCNNKSVNVTTSSIKLYSVNESGAYQCRVKVYGEGTDNKTVFSDIVNVTIKKAVPQYTKPDDVVLSYGEHKILSDIALPQGFAWMYPSTKLSVTGSVGVNHSALFIPEDTVNYERVYLTVNVIVNKADYFDITHAAISIVFFEGAVLGDTSLGSGFYWVNPEVELHADNGINQFFAAYYNIDEQNYNDYPLEIQVIVKKATPVVSVYREGNLYENTPTSEVLLSLSQGSTSGVALLVEGQNVKVGEYSSYAWCFTPENTRDYTLAYGSIELIFLKIIVADIDVAFNAGEKVFRAYDDISTLSSNGLSVSEVYNNGDKVTLSSAKYVLSCSTGTNYLLYKYTVTQYVNGESKKIIVTGSCDITVKYTYSGDTFTKVFTIGVEKAIYDDAYCAHPDVNIEYVKNRTNDLLQSYLLPKYTLIIDSVELVCAGSRVYRAKFNDDYDNHYDKIVSITFNVAKAVYKSTEVQPHKDLTVTYVKGVTTGAIELSPKYYWVNTDTELRAGSYSINIYYNADTQNFENYNLKVNIVVNKAKITLELMMQMRTFEYDGQRKTLEITKVLPEGVYVSYTTVYKVNGENVSYEGNSAYKAGLYYVYAHFYVDMKWDDPENYEPINSQWEVLLINKRSVTVNFPDLDSVLSGEKIELTTRVEGVVTGETLTVSMKIVSRENNSMVIAEGKDCMNFVLEPGYYVLVASIQSDNYLIDGVSSSYYKNFVVLGDSVEGENGEIKVTVKADEGILPDATLNVSEITGGFSYYSEIISQTLGNYDIKRLFDIKLSSSGFLGEVRVSMTIPDELTGEDITLVHIDDNGLVMVVDTTLSGNNLFFSVSSFSKFAFVAQSAAVVPPDGGNDSEKAKAPSAFLLFIIILGVFLCCVLGTYYMVFRKK